MVPCLIAPLAALALSNGSLRSRARIALDGRLVRPRSQTEERVCSLVLSTAARDPIVRRPLPSRISGPSPRFDVFVGDAFEPGNPARKFAELGENLSLLFFDLAFFRANFSYDDRGSSNRRKQSQRCDAEEHEYGTNKPPSGT